ncbi:MAG TPA: hypothetical protein VGU25_03900 [Acidobacteriaceae bacterium]|nr:hypothetical protein [Acidobacteriaceae bacterium]
MYRAFPAPPRLHWGWVLVLSIVTLGIFVPVWLFVQARWVKRATGKIRPFAWTTAYLIFYGLIFVLAFAASLFLTLTGRHELYAVINEEGVYLQRLVGFVLYVASVYLLKSALEAAPIKIPLQGLATFVFGPVYFQWFLCRYKVEGKLGEQLSGFTDTAPAAVEAAQIPPQA